MAPQSKREPKFHPNREQQSASEVVLKFHDLSACSFLVADETERLEGGKELGGE